jgi:hypothetical protein
MQRTAPKNVQRQTIVAGISDAYGRFQILLKPAYKVPNAGRTIMVKYFRIS